MTQALADVPIEAQRQFLELSRQIHEVSQKRQLEAFYNQKSGPTSPYGPYPWQVRFHDGFKDHSEGAIIAGNQTGKTRTAAAEVAMHVTGWYPQWWNGRRFKRGNRWIVAGPTNELVRDVQQRALFGSMKEGERVPSGTGWVPADMIGGHGFRQCGVPNVLDTVRVKHVSGELSEISFKSYEQGAVKFQGVELDGIWMDEEPPEHQKDIFSEAQTRIITRSGMLIFTRTPLFGRTHIIRYFTDGTPGSFYVTATWKDAPHLSEREKERLTLAYPKHERDTRTKGVPMMGIGGVYPVADEVFSCQPFKIPAHYRRICGVDFGISHPGAAAWLAYDGDSDTIYVYDCYKMADQTPTYHAQAIKSRGEWIPVAWPHDGIARDKGSGIPLKDQYAEYGVNMLAQHASWPDPDSKKGAQSRETGNMKILDRMNTGRFKVFSNLDQWFEEKRMLHRASDPPVIVAVNDDIESATRYALMMLRFATSQTEALMPSGPPQSPDLQYDPLSIL